MFGPRLVAYIDPGAGGLVTQLMLGGVAGIIVLFKLQWRRIREMVGRKFLKEQ